MKIWNLWVILLANGAFALLTNLLFFFDGIPLFKNSTSRWALIFLGLLIYSLQAGLIFVLVRKFALNHWLQRPFHAVQWLWALAVGLTLWLLTNAFLFFKLPEATLRLNSGQSFWRFFTTFLLNSIPGALIEEFLFRYLPVRYAHMMQLSRTKTLLLFMAVVVFFTITHIPAYLWQYKYTLWSLWNPFTMGIAFFFVYYATRNLAFTTLFHAFHNNSWYLFGHAEHKDYSFIILVSIFWFLLRTRTQATLWQDDESHESPNPKASV
ncbi:CPBP family glutamic-type intramembrane protease [Arundinibacter roseus]|uniref:CPBP family glutamic-type intramembrane protease n=1 Tax=Arundinibacter roseus TaxID=2070510 RepID=UPI0014043AAE|nr:CPBP family glutamic-type intramembrane protease [Arundinibacter roseus]